jgi:hypothetical protein
MWSTPTKEDSRDNPPALRPSRIATGRKTDYLSRQVKMWPTPNASDWKNRGTEEYREGRQVQLQTQVGGQLNPTFVEYLMNFPKEWTNLQTYSKIGLGDKHGTSKETRRGEILQSLLQKDASSEIQRNIRKQSSFQKKEVLQPPMYGSSNDTRQTNIDSVAKKSNTVSGKNMRPLRNTRQSKHPSFRYQSSKQRFKEPQNVMCFMSYIMALDTWKSQKADTETTTAMLCVQRAISEIMAGNVPETLSEIKKIWRSLTNKEKAWIALRCSSGNSWCSEWPEVPRVASGVKERVNRLKCLGNSIIPQIAEMIFNSIIPQIAEMIFRQLV